MQFEYPVFLILGAAATVGLLVLAWRTHRARQDALARFAAAGLSEQLTASVSPFRRRLKTVLLAVAMMALFTAAARPQVGFRWEEVQRRGIDILLALDTSKSMLATDVVPSRLERAKLGIEDLTERLDGDRCGLLPFAGRAFLFCPLTLDMDAFRESLRAVDEHIIPDPGTDIAEAIREARAALAQGANHKILVLVTDGEDLEGQALAEAERAAAEGITVHAVGVGTPGGETIPLRRPDGTTAFLRDEHGDVVTSRLDEETLQRVASMTGGVYARLGRGAEGLDAIYDQSLSLVPKQDLTQRHQKIPLERFAWPLALALFALLAEFLLGDRRRRASRRSRPAVRAGLARGAAAAVLLALALPSTARAAAADEIAPVETAAPSPPDATSEDPRLRYNHGAAAYGDGRWENAATWFQSVLPADDLALQNRAYYGLGNALFRQGEQTEQDDPAGTMACWEEAIRQYDGALALDAGDEDAAFNRDVVQRRLDAVKEREQQKQDQQQQDQPQEDQQQQQDQQQDQSSQCDSPSAGQDGQDGEPSSDASSDEQPPEEQGSENQDAQDQDAPSEGAPNEDAEPGEPNEQDASSEPSEDPSSEGQDPQDAGSQEDEPESSPSSNGERAEPEPGEPQGQGDEEPQPAPAATGEEASDPEEPTPGAAEAAQEEEGADEALTTEAAIEAQGEPGEAKPDGKGVRRGQMTEDEARLLLDSLEENEGSLRFVPQRRRSPPRKNENRSRRDW